MPLPSAKRLKILLKRQGVDKFGAEYEPGIRATKAEAPCGSRPAILRSKQIGREIHVLSKQELAAVLLALFCPWLFDINEQRMLSTGPRLHPLASHPLARGQPLPPLRGTVRVAEDLGILSAHPTVPWKSGHGPSIVPYPFIGDLLLFLFDDDEPYCINWTVKRTQKDFECPPFKMRTSKRPQRVRAEALNRLSIEVEYYRDGLIPTVRVAGDKIDATLIGNLTRAFGWSNCDLHMTPSQYQRLVDRFNDALYLKIPPIEVIIGEMQKHGLQREQCIGALNQAIWRKQLTVNLFQPILIDHPLNPEQISVFRHYSDWFQRAAS